MHEKVGEISSGISSDFDLGMRGFRIEEGFFAFFPTVS
jgi:hypothetical protein